MIYPIISFVILFIANVFPTSTDASGKSISICNIDRIDFGQFETVQITSISISIDLKNAAVYSDCLSVRIDVFLLKSQTNQLDRTIENVQTPRIFINQLDSNENYSIILQISDKKNSRILPTHIFQTLPSSDLNVLTLSGNELLTVEYIQSEVLPHTHLSIVTVPLELQRSIIHGEIILSYSLHGKQIEYQQTLKPLDSNRIFLNGQWSKRSIVFALEFPFEVSTPIEYSTLLKLFFPDDQRQSIVYRSGMFKTLLPITAEFSSSKLQIKNLCPFYIESKAVVLDNQIDQKVFSRIQCNFGKIYTTEKDLEDGRCSLPLEKLQPEHNYTVLISTTCPIVNRLSSTSSFMFYDRQRSFSFRTSFGPPDYVPLNFLFNPKTKILSWSINKDQNRIDEKNIYFGADFHYELLTQSNQNWTLLYVGNQTEFSMPKNFMTMKNVSFRIYTANRYDRQKNFSGEILLDLQSLNMSNNQSEMIIFIVLISVLLILLVFVLVFFGFCVRNKSFYGKLKEKYYRNDLPSDKELEHLRSLAQSNVMKENILYTWSHTPTNTDLSKLPRIERAFIKLDHLIGKGAFGEVYAGRIEKNQPVAIKTLLNSATENQRTDFLKEAIIMNQFDHQHVVRLMGVCFHQDNQPQFLILELMDKGDLQNFLRNSRPNHKNQECRLSYEDCLDIARQIADGASYLEQHAYVHRDLAARNCLVRSSDNKVLVKIADFGLARMLSDQDYYRKTGEALLPVRWMAPESLLDAIFTSNSDVWSFGIVLWEIITLGQVPYSPLNNQQVLSLITTTRGTLEKPSQCTQTLYELMVLCWNYIPEKRIHFDEIRSQLDEILSNSDREQPLTWFTYDLSTATARTALDNVLSHIEPPTSISFDCSDTGECRSSTSGCFSSMTGSISPSHQQRNLNVVSYQLRLIDDTTSNDFADEDNHSDIIKQSSQ